MDLNMIIFPVPKKSYKADSKNLIWINEDSVKQNKHKVFKKKFQQYSIQAKILEQNTLQLNQGMSNSFMNNSKAEGSSANGQEILITKPKLTSPHLIPCLYLPYTGGCDKMLVYFHGNAEDIGYGYNFVNNLRKQLQINVLSIEYPGYGVYEGSPNSDQILKDAETVFDFLTDTIGINPINIFLFGRSIGSGPATHLSQKKKPGALILMCPYTSIRRLVKDLVGFYTQYLVAERFVNIEKISQTKCPTLFIHGKKDTLIPCQHSIDLMNNCGGPTQIYISDQMTHNNFHLLFDIILPIKNFLRKFDFEIQRGSEFGIMLQIEQYKRPGDQTAFSHHNQEIVKQNNQHGDSNNNKENINHESFF